MTKNLSDREYYLHSKAKGETWKEGTVHAYDRGKEVQREAEIVEYHEKFKPIRRQDK